MPSHTEIGKAYAAFAAYNHSSKKDRLTQFHLEKWLKVVKALNGGPPKRLHGYTTSAEPARKRAWHNKKGWSPERRARFLNTLKAKGFKVKAK